MAPCPSPFALLCITLLIRPTLEASSHGTTQNTFRAAVYDRPARSPYNGPASPTREDALNDLRPVLESYIEQARIANAKGADIIVFPEYGLYPTGLTYAMMTSFAESVPDPGLGWNPCHDPRRYPDTETQHHLSCLALHYGMYVVANMGDIVPPSGTEKNSTRKQYNTNVAYDPTGRHVARYHKYNLFYETAYDTPDQPDYSFFDTPFGRLGTVVCFDVLFHEPIMTLIEKYEIDTVVFPTAWMNVLPYFSAVPFHGSFAIGAGVNFLASNIHHPSGRFSGSGIYTPNTTLAFRNDELSVEGALLIADLDSRPLKTDLVEPVDISLPILPGEQAPTFTSEVFGDSWTFTWLKDGEQESSVCSGDLCCHLSYDLEPTEEYFALGAFDGLHTKEGTYYLQLCGLLRCGNEEVASCGDPTVRSSSSYFSHFSLTGNYSTPYRFPQVVTDDINPAPGEWSWDGQAVSAGRTTRPLVSAIVLSRIYERDIE